MKSASKSITTESLSAPRPEPADQRSLSNKVFKIEPSMNRQFQSHGVFDGPDATTEESKGTRDKKVANMEQPRSSIAWSSLNVNLKVARNGGAICTNELSTVLDAVEGYGFLFQQLQVPSIFSCAISG